MSNFRYSSADTTFTVDKMHLALLKRITFEWESGAYEGIPMVNPKRPYGNSDVLGDLKEIYAEVFDYEVLRLEDGGSIVISEGRVISRSNEDDSDIFADIEENLYAYHRSMATVLSILTQNLSIQEGEYFKEKYGYTWKPKG